MEATHGRRFRDRLIAGRFKMPMSLTRARLSPWLWLCLAAPALAGGPPPNEFFAMDTAMVRKLGTLLGRPDVEALAALGYRGVGPIATNETMWRHLTTELLPMLDEKGLKLYAVYSSLRVDRAGPVIDPGIEQNLAALKGRGTIIWLPVTSKDFKPSDPEADDIAVAAIRQVADAAAKYGLSISLYPHYGSLVERVADAVRIADKTGRKNVGVTFNLCHWLRTDGPNTMESVLKLALPRLTLVTINGADREGKDWGSLIQPLDQGDFNVAALLTELRRLGYRGPIGLQGYDVANHFHLEPGDNLRRSMAAWKKLQGEVSHAH
jgi:sugar phosphate isomerase/epimerase